MSTCARCGYSLDGLPASTTGRTICPECAHDQTPVKRWGGTRACLVTSLAVHVPLWAGLLVVGLSLRDKSNTLIPLAFFAPGIIGTITGGIAGYKAAGRKDPAARGSGVAYVWWPVVSLLFNGLLWIVLMAICTVWALSHSNTMLFSSA